MSANSSYTALHELRRAKEISDRNRKERILGATIGAGLMALGAWGLWEHNLWLSVPFMVILVIDVFKSFKERLIINLMTIFYTVLLVISMWHHQAGPAVIAFLLIAVVFAHSYRQLKNK